MYMAGFVKGDHSLTQAVRTTVHVYGRVCQGRPFTDTGCKDYSTCIWQGLSRATIH